MSSSRRLTEYEVRPIDTDGDAIDMDAFTKVADAIKYARRIAPNYPAVVVERHRMIIEDDSLAHSDYEVVAHFGDDAVLRLWGGRNIGK